MAQVLEAPAAPAAEPSTGLHPIMPAAEPGGLERRLWTLREYRRMVEAGILDPDERVELIEGEILMMAPQTAGHFDALNLAARALADCFGDGYCVWMQGPLELGKASQPKPDVAVVPGDLDDYQNAHPTNALLVVEASDISLTYNRELKASMYAKAGIPEYWIQNLVDGVLEIRRGPIPLRLEAYGWGYSSRRLLHKGQTIAPLAVPDAEISVDELLP
jgi:Uma2 family endonuclease